MIDLIGINMNGFFSASFRTHCLIYNIECVFHPRYRRFQITEPIAHVATTATTSGQRQIETNMTAIINIVALSRHIIHTPKIGIGHSRLQSKGHELNKMIFFAPLGVTGHGTITAARAMQPGTIGQREGATHTNRSRQYDAQQYTD